MNAFENLVSKPSTIVVPTSSSVEKVPDVELSDIKQTVDPLHYMQWNRAVKKPMAQLGKGALGRRDYNRRVEAINRKTAPVDKSKKLYTTQSVKDWVESRLLSH